MRKVILALALLPIGVVNHSVHANTIDEQGKLLDQMERSISHVEQKETPAFTVLREGIVPQKMNQLSSDEPEFFIISSYHRFRPNLIFCKRWWLRKNINRMG